MPTCAPAVTPGFPNAITWITCLKWLLPFPVHDEEEEEEQQQQLRSAKEAGVNRVSVCKTCSL